MLSWQKKYDESLNEYRKILKALPDDIQVRRRYAFVLIVGGQAFRGSFGAYKRPLIR